MGFVFHVCFSFTYNGCCFVWIKLVALYLESVLSMIVDCFRIPTHSLKNVVMFDLLR